jgi:O-antigen/teichoic acid export membrane protein
MAAATALLQVQERPLPYIAVSMTGAAGAQLTGIVVVLLFHATPVAYLAGYLIASAGAALAGIALTRALHGGLASRRTLRAALAIGLPTVPHSIAILVLALGDRLIIQAFDGAGEVGRYQVAYALGGLSIMILSAVQNAWVPLTFGAEEHARWSALAQTSALVTRLAALLVGALALASPLLLRILAPGGYDPGDLDSVVAIVALAGVPWAIYLPMSQVMFWERRTKPLLWVTPSAAVINLILVVILLPPFGLEGAAAATCLAIMVQAALAARAARSMAAVPWPWRAIALNALLALALVAVAVAVGESDFAIAARALLIAAIAVGAVATVRRELAVAPVSRPG